MSAAALAEALEAHGIACDVEARDTLAVLVPRAEADALSTPEGRELTVRLAREHGFTHVAVELAPAADGA